MPFHSKMAIIKKTEITNVGNVEKEVESSYMAGGNVKGCLTLGNWEF